MTLKERYLQTLKEIESDYNAAKKTAAIQYANDCNIYNIGDMVEDHIGKLKIEKIGYHITWDSPECVYYGVRLNKNGTISKVEKSPVYQSNIANVNPNTSK